MINRNKKGLTLIEICVVFTILIIAIAVIYPFFSSNTKALSETETKSDLQGEGQYAMKCLTDKAMEAESIAEIDDIVLSDNDYIKLDSSTNSASIEFAAPDIDITTDSAISYYFVLENDILYYQQKLPHANVDHSKDKRIADSIKSIEIKTIDGKKFNECKGLNIKITLSKKEVNSYIIESQVYFRNVNKDD